MERVFMEMGKFLNQWYSLGLDDNDLCDLQSYLLLNPESGDLIESTEGS
jgi:hypothetical protein